MKTAAVSPAVVVVAVGNEFAGDDGVALRVTRAVADRRRGDTRVRFVALDGEPTRILEAWRGAPEGWVVDAMSSGVSAGTFVELDPDTVAASTAGAGRRGTHAAGVGAAIALGRAIGALPGRVRVFAIEGAEFSPGHQLSAALTDRSFDAAVDALDRALHEQLAQVGVAKVR